MRCYFSIDQRLRSSSKPLQCWEGMVASLETELPLELVDTRAADHLSLFSKPHPAARYGLKVPEPA